MDNEKLFNEYLEDLKNPVSVYTDTIDIRGLFKVCEDYPEAKIFALINNRKVPVDWNGYIEDGILFMEANVNSSPITGRNMLHNIKLEATDSCWHSIFGSLFFNCEYCIVDTNGDEDFEIENASDSDFYEVTTLKAVNGEIILGCKSNH